MTWLRIEDVGGGVNTADMLVKDALKDGTLGPSGVPAPPLSHGWVVVQFRHDDDLDEDVPVGAVGPFGCHDAAVLAALELRCDEYHVLPLVGPGEVR